MRFIKRFVFVILVLVIVFFIYRLISPKWANDLLYSLKSLSNDKIGTHFSLTGTSNISSDLVVNETGNFFEVNSGSEGLTSDEELLLSDEEFFQGNSGSEVSSWSSLSWTGSTDVVVVQTGSSTPKPSSSSSKSPSAQELRDLRDMLKNFAN